MTPQAWILLAPLIATLAAALATLVADALGGTRPAVRTATIGLALAAVLFAWTGVTRETAGVAGVVALGGTFAVLDAFMCGIAALTLAAGSRRALATEQGGQSAALVVFSTAASTVLLGAFDLAVFLVAIELVALAGYALVAAARTPRAYEAATKYFVQGAVATGLLAYGIAILYGAFGGSLSFTAIGAATATAGSVPALAVALVLILSALAFKLGAFPFHSWAPDAYETAQPSTAAYLASVPKLAALLATLMVLVTAFAAREPVWMRLAGGLAAASVAFGNLGALKQTSFRRMLAYSGVAQAGYALTGLAAGAVAVSSVMLFGLFYAVAVAGAFLAAEAAGEGGEWDGSIASLAGLGSRRPVLAASLAVCLLSLTGIPLTAGFWGKFLVFAAAASHEALWLAVVGVLGSVVSFGYYGGVLRSVYIDDPSAAPEPAPAGVSVVPEGEALGALVPRSVGAMSAAGDVRGPSWPVVVIALVLLVAGVAPLFGGLGVFAFLAG